MKLYAIGSDPNQNSYCSILDERDDGYYIRISRNNYGYEKIQEEFIDRQLFETCIRTGYLVEISPHAVNAAM